MVTDNWDDVERSDVDADAVLRLPGAARCPLLTRMPRRELELVLSTARLTTHGRRDPLHPSGGDDALYVVLRGAFFQRLGHREDIRTFAEPVGAGAVIGLTDVLTDAQFDHETRALSSSIVLRIPGGALRGLVAASGVIATAVAQIALKQLQQAERDRLVLAASDATGRILRRVSELVTDWGEASPDGVDIALPLTQEQLGAWAGSSRETTVKALQWMREENLIETSRRHLLVLDPEAIDAHATARGVAAPAGEGYGIASPRHPSPAGA